MFSRESTPIQKHRRPAKFKWVLSLLKPSDYFVIEFSIDIFYIFNRFLNKYRVYTKVIGFREPAPNTLDSRLLSYFSFKSVSIFFFFCDNYFIPTLHMIHSTSQD